MRTLVAVLAAVLVGCATQTPAPEADAPPDTHLTLTLTQEESDACDAEGGCRIMSFEKFKEAVRETAKKLRDADEHENGMEGSRRTTFGAE